MWMTIFIFLNSIILGEEVILAVDPVAPENVKTGGKADAEDDHDAEQDEGAGSQGDLLQVSLSKCP